jgi:hypothetical protein
VGELADEHRRLTLLDAGGDPRTAVRAVFSWSYRHLDAAHARMFRHLGLHPGPTIDSHAAAALIGVPPSTAVRLLNHLTRANLVYEPSPGRFTMHDLLRAYATELADTEDGPAGQRTTLTTLLDHYLTTTAAAMDTLVPAEQHRRPRVAPPDPPRPELAHRTRAQAWLDAERATLVNLVAYAAEHGWPRYAAELAATLTRYLENGGHYSDAIVVHTNARIAAQRADDPSGEAHALVSLGVIERRLGRYQQAAEHLQEALSRYRATGDTAGEARALGNLGTVEWQSGRNELAPSFAHGGSWGGWESRLDQGIGCGSDGHSCLGEDRGGGVGRWCTGRRVWRRCWGRCRWWRSTAGGLTWRGSWIGPLRYVIWRF